MSNLRQAAQAAHDAMVKWRDLNGHGMDPQIKVLGEALEKRINDSERSDLELDESTERVCSKIRAITWREVTVDCPDQFQLDLHRIFDRLRSSLSSPSPEKENGK